MISLYRVAGYLALVSIPLLLVAFALGHPIDGLTAHLNSPGG